VLDEIARVRGHWSDISRNNFIEIFEFFTVDKELFAQRVVVDLVLFVNRDL